MPFNLQTFKTRALTSVVFVVVMLAGIFINKWSFFALFTVIHFGCWFEYQKLVRLIDPAYGAINNIHKYSVMLAGWGLMLWMTSAIYNINGLRLDEIGRWMFVIMMAVFVFSVVFYKPLNLRALSHSVFGLTYISLSWALLVSLYCKGVVFGENYGWVIILILIAIIWINDTMAYVVGSFIGKTPLSPISPKKTWEGTIGGALLAVITVTVVSYFVLRDYYLHILALAVPTTITGTLGDLLESKLKRLANVKDSGAIMPGHGGFLDRFDSLLLATPFAWLLLYAFEHFA